MRCSTETKDGIGVPGLASSSTINEVGRQRKRRQAAALRTLYDEPACPRSNNNLAPRLCLTLPPT